MPSISVNFTYLTGIRRPFLKNVRLVGSWDEDGRYSDQWSTVDMQEIRGEDGCPAFTATLELDADQANWYFHWGVLLDTDSLVDTWGIMTEVKSHDSKKRIRSFQLLEPNGNSQDVRYYLNESRRLGAQKRYKPDQDEPCIRFAAWAPNAQSVEVVMSYVWDNSDPTKSPATDLQKIPSIITLPRCKLFGGYVSDSHTGIHPQWGPFPMTRQEDGIWVTDVDDPGLANFHQFDHTPYMYRITKDNGDVVYRSDIYSRCQIGFGGYRPNGPYNGNVADLEGTVSCSVVVDPDKVTENFFETAWPELQWATQDEFWKDSINDPPRPQKLVDLVIYELHIGALGFDKPDNKAGTLEDAIEFLDYVVDLGVNAIELLPLSEFGGGVGGWGYSTSHYFAIEYTGGGRDNYKWFVRECHKRGIAVILDVVYNHYSHDAERAEWMYDTDQHDKNSYYWYEGRQGDYPEFDEKVEESRKETGGYLDNMSTAWAPRYHEERIRKMFVSSAISTAMEFNIDGFRVDQTTSIRAYNGRHSDGQQVQDANLFGAKLLRELTGALKLVKPDIIIMAEDHSSNGQEVTDPINKGGLGFDAAWYADFYHHLLGDTDKGMDYAKLIKTAGLGNDDSLAMDYFAAALGSSGRGKIVYNESHDEAGNGTYTDRNIRVASNGYPLIGATRKYAEARCRFAAGVTLLSAGTPMFLFGEEVCAENKFLYGKVLENREDLVRLKNTTGKYHFEFYRKLIQFRLGSDAIKSRNIDIVYTNNSNRIIAFRRWSEDEEYLVVATLSNQPYNNPGYQITSNKIQPGQWCEVFNSDAEQFGGDNIGNFGEEIGSQNGQFECIVPANGVLVFKKT